MKPAVLMSKAGAVAACAAIATLGLGTVASAAPPPGEFPVEVRLSGTTKCLDIPGNNPYNGAPVTLYDCNGTSAQTWMLSSLDSNSTSFALKNWGKCLDIPWANSYNGAQLQIVDCGYSTAQQFSSHALGSADSIRNSIDDATRCVDDPRGGLDNGNRIELWDCNGGWNQKWEIRRR
ncbi:RICIN domain-containing protein [Kitasatospora sp. NPDC058397]|uniref:RICIN domain-containing protein n=1 Tax=unclassified Kitasatospora TaxID=2633591 RepID=UPI0036679BFB